MKVSELVEKLEQLMEINGDKEVKIYVDLEDDERVTTIDTIVNKISHFEIS